MQYTLRPPASLLCGAPEGQPLQVDQPEKIPREAAGPGSHHLGKRQDLGKKPHLAENMNLQNIASPPQESDISVPLAVNGPVNPLQTLFSRDADHVIQRGCKGDSKILQLSKALIHSSGHCFCPVPPSIEAIGHGLPHQVKNWHVEFLTGAIKSRAPTCDGCLHFLLKLKDIDRQIHEGTVHYGKNYEANKKTVQPH
jgi:hypothetical protein